MTDHPHEMKLATMAEFNRCKTLEELSDYIDTHDLTPILRELFPDAEIVDEGR